MPPRKRRGQPRIPKLEEEAGIQTLDPNIHGSFPVGRLLYVWEERRRQVGQGFAALVVRNLPASRETVVDFIGYGKKRRQTCPNSDVYISLGVLSRERNIKMENALGSMSRSKAAAEKFNKELQKYDKTGKLIQTTIRLPKPIKVKPGDIVLRPRKWFSENESGIIYSREGIKIPITRMNRLLHEANY